jgi:Fe2+ transport system protein FeoA
MCNPIPMQMLKAGETAVVDGLVGDAGSTNRLRELGLQVGVEVQMVRSGECCIIRLGSRKLGFRADETANVLVRQTAVAAGERA